jgi:hypothetical protein
MIFFREIEFKEIFLVLNLEDIYLIFLTFIEVYKGLMFFVFSLMLISLRRCFSHSEQILTKEYTFVSQNQQNLALSFIDVFIKQNIYLNNHFFYFI